MLRWAGWRGRITIAAAGGTWGAAIILVVASGVNGATVSLTPSLSVSERYTDNLLLSPTSKVVDLATIVSPGLTADYTGRAMVGNVGYRGAAEYYRRRPEENRYAQTVTASVRTPGLAAVLKGGDLRLAGSFIRTSDLPASSLTGFLGDGNEGIQLPRVDTRRTWLGMTLEYPWLPRTALTVSSSFQTTRYGRLDQGVPGGPIQLQDSTVADGGISLRRRWSDRTALTAASGVSVTAFDAPAPAPAPDRIRTQRLTAGVEYMISPRTTVNAGAGAVWVEDDRGRVTADVGLRHVLRTSSLAMQYTRGTGTGGGLNRTVTISQRASGRLTRRWDDRILGYAQLGWSRSVAPAAVGFRTTSYEAGAGLDVGILSWLGGGVSYAYLDQRSRGGIGDAERHLLTVTLTATGPSWRLLR